MLRSDPPGQGRSSELSLVGTSFAASKGSSATLRVAREIGVSIRRAYISNSPEPPSSAPGCTVYRMVPLHV